MPDADLWETTLLPVAQNFFHKVVLLELVACHYTQPSAMLQAGQKRAHENTVEE